MFGKLVMLSEQRKLTGNVMFLRHSAVDPSVHHADFTAAWNLNVDKKSREIPHNPSLWLVRAFFINSNERATSSVRRSYEHKKGINRKIARNS